MLQTKAIIREQVDGPPLVGPLLLVVHFQIPMRTAVLPNRRNRENCWPHAHRPDIDNLQKYLFDCMKDVVWKDDAQVSYLFVSKTLDKRPSGCTYIYATEVEQEHAPSSKLINLMQDYLDPKEWQDEAEQLYRIVS